MDKERLNRLRQELEKARKKRDDWDGRVKELERKYKEAENTFIHDMVHAASLTPEQLAELIRKASVSLPYTEEPREHMQTKEEASATLPHTEEIIEEEPENKDVSEKTEFRSGEEGSEREEPGTSVGTSVKVEMEDTAHAGWTKAWPRFSERRTNEKK